MFRFTTLCLLATVWCLAAAQDHMIPHVTNGESFITQISVKNILDEPQPYGFRLFNATGEVLGEIEGTLAPFQRIRQSADVWAGDLPTPAYMTVLHDQRFATVEVNYRFNLENSFFSGAVAPVLPSQRWRLKNGNWSIVFDGLAMVNTGNEATSIKVSQIDSRGNKTEVVVSESLPAGAKMTFLLGSPGGSLMGQTAAGSVFEVTADQPIALTALQGSLPPAPVPKLYGVPAAALPNTIRPSVDATIDIQSGPVRGTLENDILSFKGIPYAAPPVGELRWRSPQDPEPWLDIRDTAAFGPICPQSYNESRRSVGDEDCLTLDIWTPDDAPENGEPLPVLVYIHDGENQTGSGNQTQIQFDSISLDGGNLAKSTDSVVVTLQYRLGALGFFSHPILDADNAAAGETAPSGNYGIRDIIHALNWLQRNIAAFGGDPDAIMLMGHGSGAGNITLLLNAPDAAGLFHAASLQSGTFTTGQTDTVHDAGDALLARTGCDQADDPAGCLRELDPRYLVNSSTGTAITGPYVDGTIIREATMDAIAGGRHYAVPMLIGTNLADSRELRYHIPNEAFFIAQTDLMFGESDAAEIRALYPVEEYGSYEKAFAAMRADMINHCPDMAMAEALATNQAEEVYRYVFGETLFTPRAGPVGEVQSGLVTPFVLNDFDWYSRTLNSEENFLARAMRSYWSTLVENGDLRGVRFYPKWERYDPQNRNYLFLHGAELRMETGFRQVQCDFWRDYEAQNGTLNP